MGILHGLDRFADDYPGAIAQGAKGLQLCQALGKLRGEMSCLNGQAELLTKVHDYPAARAYGERGLHLARTLGYRGDEGVSQLDLSNVMRLLGEYTAAYTLGEEAFAIFLELAIMRSQQWLRWRWVNCTAIWAAALVPINGFTSFCA